MPKVDERSTSMTRCTADFCLIPIGGEDGASVGKYITECQRVLAKTGLEYKVGSVYLFPIDYLISSVEAYRSCMLRFIARSQMHGYGTGLEGPWDEVMNAIKACHEAGQHHIKTDKKIPS
ncbi:hypothetical protein PGTUg99_010954 [Puccinia graminis f. sp. tritici]|uniref:Thiamine-binding protein domain-containing protein n=1 Tax=Puccinia graminis f. sp. tritici TaxID=56615 RepID=A0A5B0PDB3_PUCGR|nr:hypothetical protein PGTUg99_010954 [Puccinia graminis f. sp. tritici]